MPSRRPHTNSHHGCLQCKAKRVKCDQNQPQCSRCLKRGTECVYRHIMTSYNPFPPAASPSSSAGPQLQMQRNIELVSSSAYTPSSFPTARPSPNSLGTVPSPTTSTTSASTSSSAHTAATTPFPPCSPPMQHLPPLNANDQFLLYHYTTNLNGPLMAPVLETEIFPTLSSAILHYAHTNVYVRHIVLSFSALHLASVHPNPMPQHGFYLESALHHKAIALELYRSELNSGLNPDTGHPLLAASAVFIACALGLPAADPECVTAFDRIELIAQVAGLYQGKTAIFKMGIYGPFPQYADEDSVAYNPPPPTDIPWHEVEGSLQMTLRAIDAIVPRSEQENNRKRILAHAGAKLRNTLHLVFPSPKNYHIFCIWLGIVKRGFVDLIYARDPLALSLVAHWSICRSSLNELWWARGWQTAAVMAVADSVDDDHQYLLDWCVSRAEMEPVGPPPPPGPPVERQFYMASPGYDQGYDPGYDTGYGGRRDSFPSPRRDY